MVNHVNSSSPNGRRRASQGLGAAKQTRRKDATPRRTSHTNPANGWRSSRTTARIGPNDSSPPACRHHSEGPGTKGQAHPAHLRGHRALTQPPHVLVIASIPVPFSTSRHPRHDALLHHITSAAGNPSSMGTRTQLSLRFEIPFATPNSYPTLALNSKPLDKPLSICG